MSRGECDCGLGLVFYLHFSSVYTEDPAEANGELAPQSQAPYSHSSYLVLEDVSMTASAAPMQLDVPFRDDLDNDGIPDFFNLNQEVGSTTGGTYESVWGSGTITAVWSRASGSTSGSCTITLRDPMLGVLGPFYNGFEIIQSKRIAIL